MFKNSCKFYTATSIHKNGQGFLEMLKVGFSGLDFFGMQTVAMFVIISILACSTKPCNHCIPCRTFLSKTFWYLSNFGPFYDPFLIYLFYQGWLFSGLAVDGRSWRLHFSIPAQIPPKKNILSAFSLRHDKLAYSESRRISNPAFIGLVEYTVRNPVSD